MPRCEILTLPCFESELDAPGLCEVRSVVLRFGGFGLCLPVAVANSERSSQNFSAATVYDWGCGRI